MSLIHEVSEIFKEKVYPKRWITIELNKVVKIQNGYAFKSSNFNSDKKGMPLIRIRNIKNSTMETFYNGEILDEYTVVEDDFLIGMDGDFNSNLWKGKPALLNQRVCRLIPNEKIILKKLLYYGLPEYLTKINENTSSTTVKHLSSKSIGEIPFPLPPLSEQNRIVAKLDMLSTQMDIIKTSMSNIPVLLKDFRQQVLTQAVTGKLTKEFEYKFLLKEIIDDKKEWFRVQLEKSIKQKGKKPKKIITESDGDKSYLNKFLNRKIDVVFLDEISAKKDNALKAGPFGSSLKKEFYVENGFKIYGQEQVINDDPYIGDYYINEEKFNELRSCEVEENDILISLVGTIGKVLIIPKNFEKGIINPRLVKLSLHEKVNPKYIKIYLQSKIVKDFLKEKSHGGTMDVLNLGIIKSLPIPLPSTEEQQEIVYRVESLFAKADAIEQQYKSLKDKIDTLPQALLHKAFKGELTEQLDTDDDARELVKEIKELKAQTAKVSKKKQNINIYEN